MPGTSLRRARACVTLLAFVVIPSPSAASAGCGDVLATYRNVDAKSNNGDQWSKDSCAGRGIYGNQYQCTEYVKRFYNEAFGVNTLAWPDANAGDPNHPNTPFLGAGAPPNFSVFYNGGTVAPRADDIVVFSGGDYGHAAIVTAVTSTQVSIIEQNWSVNGTATLTMTSQNGVYNVVRPRSSYRVVAWLRQNAALILDQAFDPIDQGPTDPVVGAGVCNPAEIPFSRQGQFAQTFRAGLSGTLRAIEIKVYAAAVSPPVGTPLSIDVIGTNDGLPQLSNTLGSGTFTSDALPPVGVQDWVSIDLAVAGVPITAGQSYAIVARRPREGCYLWLLDQRGGYSGGDAFFLYDSGGVSVEGDLGFQTFVILSSPNFGEVPPQ